MTTWISFVIFALLYFANCIITKTQDFSWLLLTVYALVISVFLLTKHKFLKGKAIITPVVFACIYLVSNIYRFNLFSLIQAAIVFLSSCAVISTYKDVTGSDFHWVKNGKKLDFVWSILLGILVGIVWGAINYFLMQGSNEKVPTSILKAGIVALNPAVIEEISYRTLFYAFCIHAMNGLPKSKKESFTCWFMMMIPHILPHIMFTGSLDFVIYLILYIVVFGSVFAILQRKRDVMSAMIAHGLVDAIRFVIFGLPY